MAEASTTKERREALRSKVQEKLAGSDDGISPVDGVQRSIKEEHALNELLAMCFRGKRGNDGLAYLHALTFGTIAGPGVDPNHLLHLEGSRFLYGIIKARVELGRKTK